jgi:hypothetical protein
MRWLPRSLPVRVLIVFVVLLAIGWGVLRQVAGTSDPVTDREALSTFNAAPRGSVPAGGPAPGVYRYRATGSERGGAGPLSISRDTPAEARLVVTSSGSGWEAELSYSRQHIEGARYELRDGAIRVTSRRTKVTFAGFGQDDRRTVDPPSVFLPAGAAPGTQWTEVFHTGDISVSTRNRVLRTEHVTVDGKGLDTLVVESRSTTNGVHPGTRTETLWWAPALGLPVRWDVDMDIGGVFAFRSRISVALLSAIGDR